MFLQPSDFNSTTQNNPTFEEKVSDFKNSKSQQIFDKDQLQKIKNNYTASQNQIKHKRSKDHVLNYKPSEIDTTALEQILKNSNQNLQVYEPGLQFQSNSNEALPVLSQVDNKFNSNTEKNPGLNQNQEEEINEIQGQGVEQVKNVQDFQINEDENVINDSSSSTSVEEPKTERNSQNNLENNSSEQTSQACNNVSQSRSMIKFDDDCGEDGGHNQSKLANFKNEDQSLDCFQVSKTKREEKQLSSGKRKYSLEQSPYEKIIKEFEDEKQQQQQISDKKFENCTENSQEDEDDDDDDNNSNINNSDDEDYEDEEDGDSEDNNENRKEGENQNQVLQPKLNMVFGLPYQDLKQFLIKPVEQGNLLHCEIKRKKGLFTSYQFSINNGQNLLMKAKKKITVKNSYFYISMVCPKTNQDILIGKLKGKFFGSQFELFDDGENPKKIKDVNTQKPRNQLAVIICKIVNSLKNFSIILPKVSENGQMFQHKQQVSQQTLLKYYKSYRKLEQKQQQKYNKNNQNTHLIESVSEFTNQTPWYNPSKKGFELDFSERVKESSIQNFVVIDKQKQDEFNSKLSIKEKSNNCINKTGKFVHYLQVGKQGNNIYNIDFQWPITPLQAFAIALANFNARWD